MRHDEIWSRYFAPPLATHGEAIAATILFLSVFLSGGLLAWTELDALLTAGAEGFAALGGGVLIGMILGLAVLALAYQGGRRTEAVAEWQAAAAVSMGIAAAAASLWIVAPRLRADPARYVSLEAGSYVRTYSRGGQETRREVVSAEQLSAEGWVRDTGMAAGAVTAFALIALVPLLHAVPRAGLVAGGLATFVRRHLLGRGDASIPTKSFEGNACEVCGELRCDIVAPVWCVSLGIVTSRQFGPPRRLCPWHARWNAAAAVGVCATLGWWGIPWGPIWTCSALWNNLTQGGLVVDRATALALDAQGGHSLSIRSKGVAALGVLLLLLLAYALMRAR